MNYRPLLLIMPYLALFTMSCFYDLDIPLSNDLPICQNPSSINKTLTYPENTVCTLHIDDLNDNILTCAISPCSSLANCNPDSIELPWPGTYKILNQSYNTKDICLCLDRNRMGLFIGQLLVRDAHRARTVIPFEIKKQLYDPFEVHPFTSPFWKPYCNDDTSIIKLDFTDKKLLFSFGISDSTQLYSTGIVSTFMIAGDFFITVDLRIRDEMDDGFETGFFVSSSADTGRWSGNIAGIFLQGSQQRIRLECKSVELQSFSREVDLFAGELGIRRTGKKISFFYHDGNPLITPASLVQHTFPSTDSVFVHIKMNVNDRKRFRHSLWNDFYVLEGQIVPNVN